MVEVNIRFFLWSDLILYSLFLKALKNIVISSDVILAYYCDVFAGMFLKNW